MSGLPPDDQETRRRPDLSQRRSAKDRINWDAVQSDDKTRHHEKTIEQPPPDPESSGLYIPWWGFVLVIMAVAAIACGLWAFVLFNRGDVSTSDGPTPTPIFVVITATPTLGPAPDEITPTTEFVAPTDVPLPISPSPEAVQIEIGMTVQVVGTEGDGLSIRQGPGLSFTTFFIGQDGELFVVQDGPENSDGFVWWYIEDVNDPTRAGWSVEDFLQVVK